MGGMTVVSDISDERQAAEQARLVAQGVTFIRTAGREFWGRDLHLP